MSAIWIFEKPKRTWKNSFFKRNFVDRVRYIPIVFIAVYQQGISPFLSPSCRFHPTCSTYARQAFLKYGLLKGGLLAVVRLVKCHPFHPGGYDPLT